MITNLSLDEMLRQIEFENVRLNESIKDITKGYESRTSDYAKIPKLDESDDGSIFRRSAIELAYENAIMWGKAPISTQVFLGNKGSIIQIIDSGDGFDYEEKITKYESFKAKKLPKTEIRRMLEARKSYANNLGQGFEMYDRCDLKISFQGNGNTINLMYLK